MRISGPGGRGGEEESGERGGGAARLSPRSGIPTVAVPRCPRGSPPALAGSVLYPEKTKNRFCETKPPHFSFQGKAGSAGRYGRWGWDAPSQPPTSQMSITSEHSLTFWGLGWILWPYFWLRGVQLGWGAPRARSAQLVKSAGPPAGAKGCPNFFLCSFSWGRLRYEHKELLSQAASVPGEHGSSSTRE